MNDKFLDHPILSSRYFYPWPNRFEVPFFVKGDGFRLGCRFRRISTDAPTIIHFHSNGESAEAQQSGAAKRHTITEAEQKAKGKSAIAFLRGPVLLTHIFMESFVHEGDNVVDATCGNGHDTLALAGMVGPGGHVWGFDIQGQAIVETGRRVSEAGYADRVTLLQVGHEEIGRHLQDPVKVVLFNLGYLPGSDRTITTRPETTVAALDQSLQLLVTGGIVMVTVYPGHSGGSAERQAVDKWAARLESRKYHSWRMGQCNVASDAPYCILVQKAA